MAPSTGGVTIKKGEVVLLFLEHAKGISSRREWLRVSVDDLLLVRGEANTSRIPPTPISFRNH